MAPATTDAAGFYSLELPIGDYTLRASAGGCTEIVTVDISLTEDLTQDFSLFRKLDDFGHGCRQIAFDWVDATGQTALYGDEIAGRLRLPFDFQFYGETYTQVWLSENGFMNFLGPRQGDFFPSGIPSASDRRMPGSTCMWQDFELDDESSIDYELIGSSPDRAFVIEYSNIKVFGASQRASFEVKLWENGTIDMLYGANAANPGDGRNAVIGIENATGTDALQFSMFEDRPRPEHRVPLRARAERPRPGRRHRRQRRRADRRCDRHGQPDGSLHDHRRRRHVLAPPAARLVHDRGERRELRLRLRPGDRGRRRRHHARLRARRRHRVVEPTEINETVDFGETTDVDVTLSNTGSAPLVWEVKERDQGVTLPDLPPASITRDPAAHLGAASDPRRRSRGSSSTTPAPCR